MSDAEKIRRAQARVHRAELQLAILLDRAAGARDQVRAAKQALASLKRQPRRR
jgi:hypothetical protein